MIRTAIAKADITPQESVPLMGYGDRTHNSEGVHDPLFAYAWWLEPENGEAFAWVVLDLCLLSVPAMQDLASAISEKVDLPTGRIHLSATHTHSGPDVRFVSRDDEPWAQRYYRRLIDGCAAAVRQAGESAVPCTIEVRTAESELAVNRRDSRSAIDPRVVLFSLVDEAGKQNGLLFHYSCHLTALGVDNYLISADWIGPVRNTLASRLDTPVMFLQGAEGNADPVCRGALDMADPDQAVGSSFEVMTQTAERMTEALEQGLSAGHTAVIQNVGVYSQILSLPLRFGGLTSAQVEEKLKGWKSKFAAFLQIPVEEVPEGSIVNAMVKEHSRKQNLDAEEVRRWVAEQFTYVSFLNIYKIGGELIDAEKGEVRCPIHLLDFGTVKILGIPAEVLLDVAFDWQRRLPDSVALIAGLFGGWIGYMPHRDNFAEPKAAQLYETVCSMFAPESSLELLDAAEKQL